MPGRLFLTHTAAEVGAALGAAPSDLAPRHNVQPSQNVPVLTVDGWREMRWGMIPVGRVNARGRPVMETIINARSETVFSKSAFADVRRGVVPATGWYEWTGEKRRKTPWAFRLKSGQPIAFAAIWDRWERAGAAVDQVATITCEPNGDVAPIHHRMGVILSPQDVGLWLSGSDPVPLMAPLADGLLDIQRAPKIDWTAP